LRKRQLFGGSGESSGGHCVRAEIAASCARLRPIAAFALIVRTDFAIVAAAGFCAGPRFGHDSILGERRMIKEFQEFIARGNVMDLAVGVIVGGAFGLIVSSFVDDIIMPVVGAIFGGFDFSNYFVPLS
jgi:hypothetical protein